MKLFLGSRDVTLDDEGEVKVAVQPLSTADYVNTMRVMAPMMAQEEDASDPAKLARMIFDSTDMASLMADVLPRYASNLRGVEIISDDGTERAATVDDLVNQGGFYMLAAALMSQLVTISQPDSDAEKKSPKQRRNTRKA